MKSWKAKPTVDVYMKRVVILQPISAGLYRSDYLLHQAARNGIKQVEINTVASSFGGITTVLTPLHRYIY